MPIWSVKILRLQLIAMIAISTLSACSQHISKTVSAKSLDHEDDPDPQADASKASFSLSEEKQKAAGIRVEPVEERSVQAFSTVPGRVRYDDSRHIEVKAPTAGIVLEVLMHPGTQVKEGDVLALVNCPEVGSARADVLKRQVEFELARQKLDWKASACSGLDKLVAAVQEGRDPQTFFEDMATLRVGNYRDQVISAYSRYRLAQSLATAIGSASDSGAISGKTIQERISERDSARAALSAVTEQLLFQARQESDTAQLELDDSERRLKISRQIVQTLLGDNEKKAPEIDEDHLSLVEIRAPIGGTIESRAFSNRERVTQADTLFVLANTTQLWVAADIREQEWGALRLEPGEPLQITSPALPAKILMSKVEYVGREVDPQNNAVPLVAAISNQDGILRPGQFVWVKLPLGKARAGVTVPESAIVEHNGQAFVFVPESDNRFRRVDVHTGIQQDKIVEITSGLKTGETVVVSGAFALKSEMLLEREE